MLLIQKHNVKYISYHVANNAWLPHDVHRSPQGILRHVWRMAKMRSCRDRAVLLKCLAEASGEWFCSTVLTKSLEHLRQQSLPFPFLQILALPWVKMFERKNKPFGGV